jgi:hypothetical protein
VLEGSEVWNRPQKSAADLVRSASRNRGVAIAGSFRSVRSAARAKAMAASVFS